MWIALVSARSTGKTTNTWWCLHTLQARGYPVVGFDADESEHLYRWGEALPTSNGEAPPFKVHRLANSRFHEEAPPLLPEGHIGVVDVGHLENHAKIGWSVLRLADLVLVNCAPTTSDVERMDDLPMDHFIAQSAPKRPDKKAPEAWVLLCRNQAGTTKAVNDIRNDLRKDEWNVLSTVIPARQVYSTTGEGVIIRPAGTHYDTLVTELEEKRLIHK